MFNLAQIAQLGAIYKKVNCNEISKDESIFAIFEVMFPTVPISNSTREDFFRIQSIIKGKESFFSLPELKDLLGEYKRSSSSITIPSAQDFINFLERKIQK